MTLNDKLISKVLWTNSSPTSTFGAQTITLTTPLTDFDSYAIIYKDKTNENYYFNTGILPKGVGTRLFDLYASGATGASIRSRVVSSVTNTTITFDKGQFAHGDTNAVDDNAVLVPIYIIGYKTGLFN